MLVEGGTGKSPGERLLDFSLVRGTCSAGMLSKAHLHELDRDQSHKEKGPMKRALILAILSILAVDGVSFAQKKPKDKPVAKGSDAGYQKEKSYNFDGDNIEGDLVKQDGDFVETRNFAVHTSLIKIRDNFIKEIVKSAEDL